VTGWLGLDGSGWQQGLIRAEIATKRFARSMGGRFAALFSVGALTLAVRRTAEYGAQLTKLSGQTGASVESLQRMDRALKDSGASLEDLTTAWVHMNVAREKALAKPQGEEASAFQRLGVSRGDLATQTAEQITRKIVLTFQNTTNVEALLAPFRQVAGRGAAALVHAFRDGLDQMYQDIEVMSDEEAQMLDELQNSWDSMWQTLQVRLAPAIIIATQAMSDFVVVITDLWAALKKAGFKPKLEYLLPGYGQFRMAQDAISFFRKGPAGADKDLSTRWATFLEEFNRRQGEWANREKATQDERKRRIEARKRFDPLAFEDEAAPAAKARLHSDALLAVGNFLGSGRDTIQRIAEQQLLVERQQLIALNAIRTNTTRPREDIGVV